MSSPYFDAAYKRTLIFEGGLSNDPDDRGGLTKYGITQATWAAYCKATGRAVSPVSRITHEDAEAVYERNYWHAAGLDRIEGRAPQSVLNEIYDAGVNCGIGASAKFAQAAYNLIATDGMQRLVVDGKIGPLSARAIAEICERYKDAYLAALRGVRFVHYLNCMDKDKSFWERLLIFCVDVIRRTNSQRKFIRGWLKRLV